MFEIAELGRSTDRKTYRKAVPVLRSRLYELQHELLSHARNQVLLVFAGVDGAGKSQTINLLNEWLDSRWLVTRAFDEPTDAELERPEFWRYWLALPPRGRIGLFISSWYHLALLERVYGRIGKSAFERRLDRILNFENALTSDGAIIVKFWMHLGREALTQRLKTMQKDPFLHVWVRDRDWRNLEKYDSFIEAAERTITRTNTGDAPWHIVEGVDPNYRSLAVGEIIRDTIVRQLDPARGGPGQADPGSDPGAPPELRIEAESTQDRAFPDVGGSTVLNQLDADRTIGKAAYARSLRKWQSRLYELQLEAYSRGISTIAVFEGPDAAGKGGAIRRITAALDARNFQVHAIAAPTDEENAQHYLWRFWRLLDRAGRVTIFDRSWYGRVLVERLEGYATEPQWRRAFAEINDFEEQLVEHGILLMKFWIHITPEEQLNRFQAREKTPHKRWKITDEDWRNRSKWADYEQAADDMFQYTSTSLAPWVLVEGNDKRYARIKVLKTLCERLGRHLESTGKTNTKKR